MDNYFGTEVPIPTAGSRTTAPEATAAWVAAENAVTEDYLAQIPFRDAIRTRLTELWNYPKEGAPPNTATGTTITITTDCRTSRSSTARAQPGEAGEVFLDPNTLSEDGTVALAAASFSKDGRYFAYAAAASGSDWVEIRVMDTGPRPLTEDRINWVKFSGAPGLPTPRDSITAPTTLRREASTRRRTSSRRSTTIVGHAAVGRPARLRGPGASAALLLGLAERGRQVALRHGLGGNFRNGDPLSGRPPRSGSDACLPGFDADYAPVDRRRTTSIT